MRPETVPSHGRRTRATLIKVLISIHIPSRINLSFISPNVATEGGASGSGDASPMREEMRLSMATPARGVAAAVAEAPAPAPVAAPVSWPRRRLPPGAEVYITEGSLGGRMAGPPDETPTWAGRSRRSPIMKPAPITWMMSPALVPGTGASNIAW